MMFFELFLLRKISEFPSRTRTHNLQIADDNDDLENIIIIVFVVIGGSYLIKHMWSLRVRKYSRTSNRRLKTKHE